MGVLLKIFMKTAFILLYLDFVVIQCSLQVDESNQEGAGFPWDTLEGVERRVKRGYSFHQLQDDEIMTGRKIYKNPRNAPSGECPRDDDAVLRMGRKCLRKCTDDASCLSPKKKCLCDGICGLSCIKPDKECDDLVNPLYGFVEVNGKVVGSKAKYKCQQLGYHLIGAEERLCQADGFWSGTPPECRENLYCTDPPIIANARHNGQESRTRFEVNHALQYSCVKGFSSKGFNTSKCLLYNSTMQWFGPEMYCEPKSCGELPAIKNGEKMGNCNTYSCKVSYKCDEGYELNGDPNHYCQEDGTWSPKEPPTCNSVQCVPPTDPLNGRVVYTAWTFKSVASYSCDYEFKTVGPTTRHCLANKTWSGEEPECKEIKCEHPGHLPNGWIENLDHGIALGSSIIFRCFSNTTIVGEQSAICQNNGTWSKPAPKCMAGCIVPNVRHGSLENARSQVKVDHAFVLNVTCNENYELAHGGISLPACHNGSWSRVPKCQPARCKTLPNGPRHGMVIAPRAEHGMMAKYRCRDGYRLIGNATTRCHYGNWTSDTPVCKEIYCPFPGEIVNGKVLLVGNMGMYAYRPYVKKVKNNRQIRYKCEKGFYLVKGPPGATCVGGKWSPSKKPKCIPDMHPRISWIKKRSIDVEESKGSELEIEVIPLAPNETLDDIPDEPDEGDDKSTPSPPIQQQLPLNDDLQFENDVDFMTNQTLMMGNTSFDSLPETIETEGTSKVLNLQELIEKKSPRTNLVISDNHPNNVDEKENITLTNDNTILNAQINNSIDNHFLYYNDSDNVTSNSQTEDHTTIVSTVKIAQLKSLNSSGSLNENTNKTSTVNSKEKANSISQTYNGKSITEQMLNAVKSGKELEGDVANFYRMMRDEQDSEELINLDDWTALSRVPRSAKFEDPIYEDEKDAEYSQTLFPKQKSENEESLESPKNAQNTLDYNRYLQWKNTDSKIQSLGANIYSLVDSKKFLFKGRSKRSIAGTEEELTKKEKRRLLKGKKGRRRRKGIGHCEDLPDAPYLKVDVLRPGRDDNFTYSSGARVKISCADGYGLNIGNKTAKCTRGRWKPMKPECVTLPCTIPKAALGHFLYNGYEMVEHATVSHGEVVNFMCKPGYTVLGSNTMRCWYGGWAVTGSNPECKPDPCKLPELINGKYNSGYKRGLTIIHGSPADYTCNEDYVKQVTGITCHLGKLHPKNPHCKSLRPQVTNPPINIEKKNVVKEVATASSSTTSFSETSAAITSNSLSSSQPDVNMKGYEGKAYSDGVAAASTMKESPTTYPIKNCTKPYVPNSQIINGQGVTLNATDTEIMNGTEINIICTNQQLEDVKKWIMVCVEGLWNGTMLNCDHVDWGIKNCKWKRDDETIVTFYEDQEVTEDEVMFPPATILVNRCQDIGKYSHVGTINQKCYQGEFTGDPPSCVGLSQLNNYSVEMPPTILIRHMNGPIAQTNDGKMLIYPGTILYLECLWTRKFGTPTWNVTTTTELLHKKKKKKKKRRPKGGKGRGMVSTSKKHQEGWVTDPRRNRQLEYRLTINRAKKEDQGKYTCTTPRKMEHSITIVVIDVNCPEIVLQEGMIADHLSTKLSSVITFTCDAGSSLVGAPSIICKPSGNWSAPVPSCQKVRCKPPKPPENGVVTGDGPFNAGDMVEVTCASDFVMEGHPFLVCEEDGSWSHDAPKCVQTCTYPGTIISGTMSKVKFYYGLNENITYSCSKGFVLHGAQSLICLEGAKWSAAVPSCLPVDS